MTERYGTELTARQRVKIELDTHGLTSKWLLRRLQGRGMKISASTLSVAISGSRSGKGYEDIIAACLRELRVYRERMCDDGDA